jgi:hypothetical protein
MAVESTTDDVIVRTVKLEEERLADLKSTELLLPAGLPKVDFVERIQV